MTKGQSFIETRSLSLCLTLLCEKSFNILVWLEIQTDMDVLALTCHLVGDAFNPPDIHKVSRRTCNRSMKRNHWPRLYTVTDKHAAAVHAGPYCSSFWKHIIHTDAWGQHRSLQTKQTINLKTSLAACPDLIFKREKSFFSSLLKLDECALGQHLSWQFEAPKCHNGSGKNCVYYLLRFWVYSRTTSMEIHDVWWPAWQIRQRYKVQL